MNTNTKIIIGFILAAVLGVVVGGGVTLAIVTVQHSNTIAQMEEEHALTIETLKAEKERASDLEKLYENAERSLELFKQSTKATESLDLESMADMLSSSSDILGEINDIDLKGYTDMIKDMGELGG